MVAPSFGQELLGRYGSPLYVYDLDEAERQAKALFGLLPQSSQILYSVKANPIPELCAALKTAGCRVEIASPLELKVVLEAGFAPDQILCSGPGKTASLVREMLLAGVTHFSCDSWYDLERLSGVAAATKKSANALLRLQVSGAPTAPERSQPSAPDHARRGRDRADARRLHQLVGSDMVRARAAALFAQIAGSTR